MARSRCSHKPVLQRNPSALYGFQHWASFTWRRFASFLTTIDRHAFKQAALAHGTYFPKRSLQGDMPSIARRHLGAMGGSWTRGLLCYRPTWASKTQMPRCLSKSVVGSLPKNDRQP